MLNFILFQLRWSPSWIENLEKEAKILHWGLNEQKQELKGSWKRKMIDEKEFQKFLHEKFKERVSNGREKNKADYAAIGAEH